MSADGTVFPGFVPEGDKVYQIQAQRPGQFIAITEQGRLFEVVVFMESQEISTRQWASKDWDDQAVQAEMARVDAEMAKQQAMQQAAAAHARGRAAAAPNPGQEQYGNRGPAGAPSKIIKPTGAVPGTI